MKFRAEWGPKTNISTIEEVLAGKFFIPSDRTDRPEFLNIPQIKKGNFEEFVAALLEKGVSVEIIREGGCQ